MNEKAILRLALAFLIKQIESNGEITLGALLEVYEMVGIKDKDPNPLKGVSVQSLRELLERMNNEP